MRRPEFTLLGAASMASAIFALVVPWVPRALGSQIELGTIIQLLILFPLLWAALTIGALAQRRMGAIWTLLGTPIALFNLVWFFLTFSPCDPTGTRCL